MPDIPKIMIPPSEDEHRRNHVGFDELRILTRSINEWKEENTLSRAAGHHRQRLAYGVKRMLNSGIKVRAIEKIRWRDIHVNSKDSPKQDECNCEVPIIIEYLKRISSFTSPSNLLFCNQNDGKAFSTRISTDCWNKPIK